jgi:hypothetical protein
MGAWDGLVVLRDIKKLFQLPFILTIQWPIVLIFAAFNYLPPCISIQSCFGGSYGLDLGVGEGYALRSRRRMR